MITGEIKKYHEPVYAYTGPTKPTQLEIDAAIVEAKEKINIGDLFEYISNTGILKVVGYDNNPATVTVYQGKPAVIWLERLDNRGKYHFALTELFGAHMRPVQDTDDTLTIPGC